MPVSLQYVLSSLSSLSFVGLVISVGVFPTASLRTLASQAVRFATSGALLGGVTYAPAL